MGLSKASTGRGSIDSGLVIKKIHETDKIVALAGNPNVGKSTVFNVLTGLKQHTGNWPGKTVTNAQGYCKYHDKGYVLVDLPGCYSLMAHSAEEECARDFVCFQKPDSVIVVCDATCLERNLNLVLQTIELTPNVLVCVNLMDEAKKKKIRLDLDKLSSTLGVSVVGTAARGKEGIDALMKSLNGLFDKPSGTSKIKIPYPAYIEDIIELLLPSVEKTCKNLIDPRWLSLKLLEGDEALLDSINKYLGTDIHEEPGVSESLRRFNEFLSKNDITEEKMKDDIVSSIVDVAEKISKETVTYQNEAFNSRDRKIDHILTSKWAGFPIMLLALLVTFWITITLSNYPSQLLSSALFWLEEHLLNFLIRIGTPEFLYEMLIHGVYRVLAWVVSVMLPPMAIFFPLFTLMEDVGYLPRVAFNLDKCYKKCSACGKQALTMCMGFGCNAAGVTGCRIIDSPRERLIAIITNNFVPCNGRFPMLIAILTMFFVSGTAGVSRSLLSALLLTCLIVLGVAATFSVSKILSKTILKGVPSSFTLELPPYRKPQVGKVIVRSIFDRTLFVLGRAAAVAAPAGLIIWLMANISVGGATLLAHCSNFLDPFARLLGMDGVILLAFILGFPANEIVIPIVIMAYMATGNIIDISDLSVLKQLLIDNGWTWITAVSVMLFSLMHWPCSTTCLTIKKETRSLKWTAVSFLVPTLAGILVCFIFANTANLFV